MINSVLKEESDDQLDMKELMNVAEGSPDLSSTYADRTIALKPGIQSQVMQLAQHYALYQFICISAEYYRKNSN